MVDLIPVDHDPFDDPPADLIPVDHDPFAVGPVAQPADPAAAGAGTAAPQLVPVDHDPFAAARTGVIPRIIVHPMTSNPPPDNPAGADGIDDWFVPTADGYPDDWFVPAPVATPGQSGPGAQSNAAVPPLSNPPALRPDPFAAFGSLIPTSRVGAMAWDPPIFPGDSTSFSPDRPTPSVWPAGPPRRKPEHSDIWRPFRRFGSAGAGESRSWIRAPVWRPAECSGRAGAVEPGSRERVPISAATAIRGRATCLANRTQTDHGLFDRRDCR